MNLARHYDRLAGAVMTGTRYALSRGQLPESWFVAQHDFDEEAREAAFRENADRMDAEILSRRRS